MELFYAYEVSAGVCHLDADESAHCVRVLRHRAGDEIDVMDGAGTLYHCRVADDSPKGVSATVLSVREGFGAHPYHLTIGCCPTKNNDRFEWFVEKATEVGVDRIVPLIGEHSERRVYKSERAARIALSAAKQSLKARVPEIADAVSVREFLQGAKGGPGVLGGARGPEFAGGPGFATADGPRALRLIAYCFEDPSVPRISIREALEKAFPRGQSRGADRGVDGSAGTSAVGGPNGPARPEIVVLIGPEGDFSAGEAALAVAQGYIPVHLGPSRLRTETAAVTAAIATYLHFLHP